MNAKQHQQVLAGYQQSLQRHQGDWRRSIDVAVELLLYYRDTGTLCAETTRQWNRWEEK